MSREPEPPNSNGEHEESRSTPRGSWLDRPGAGKRIYHVLIAVCALLFLADALYHKHVHYGFEGWFGFYGIYGFVSCVGLVLAATQMRKLVMRGEDYYD